MRRILIKSPKIGKIRLNLPLPIRPRKVAPISIGRGRKLELKFEIDKASIKSPEIVKTWNERTRKLLKMIPYLAAEFVLREIRSRLPRTEEMRAYKQALEAAQVLGVPDNEPVTAVRLNQFHRRIRKIRPDRNVLYVKPREHSIKKTKPEVLVLERFSPWTFDTIPFVPEKADATLISRKVSVIEVRMIAKKRKTDKVKWRRELASTGWKPSREKEDVKPKRKSKAIPDIVFQVLRMEFGLGDERSVPHWRPSIRLLTRSGIRRIIRQVRGLNRLFTDPSFRQWEKWPPRTANRVRLQEARGYAAFQRKLGVRVS